MYKNGSRKPGSYPLNIARQIAEIRVESPFQACRDALLGFSYEIPCVAQGKPVHMRLHEDMVFFHAKNP